MTLEELVGDYRIKGHNQDAVKSSYEGKLSLSLDQNRRIIALWNINGHQVQKGTGFFKDQILVVNFNYLGELDQVFKGVVVYKCLSKDVLDGFWSEKYGDPLFLGGEQAFKIHKNKPLLN
jgi:hypothetical protein